MSNTAIQLKKSGVTGNTPSGLAFGEVALNYADGKLFYKNSLGGTSSISNQFSFDTINSNNSLIFAGSGSDTLSFVAGNNITISTNTTTKTITINASVSGGSDPGPAFDRANGAYSHANAAYTAANNSADTWVRTQANNAYDKANSSGSFANGAFVQANSNYTSAVTKLVVTTPGMYYSVDQYSGNNPTIYIRAGETIAFLLDNVSGHPFMLRETAGGTNYSTGLTHVSTSGVVTTGSGAQGQTTGTIYWKVPFVLAGLTYVYQCSVHSGMVGNIVIDQPTAIAFLTANAAYTAQNTTAGFANAAFNTANASYTSQNTTAIFANAAFIHANAAFDKANTGTTALDTNSDIVAFTIAFS